MKGKIIIYKLSLFNFILNYINFSTAGVDIYKGSDSSWIRSSQKLDTVNWHHLIFTFTGTTGRFYINNTLTATKNNM